MENLCVQELLADEFFDPKSLNNLLRLLLLMRKFDCVFCRTGFYYLFI